MILSVITKPLKETKKVMLASVIPTLFVMSLKHKKGTLGKE